MGGEERRARLARRHRLTAETRAAGPLEVATSLVALHSTDAATVFLSTWARSLDFRPQSLEEALYDERTLVRMLGMRRTLWVVALDLAPVVDAACTRAVAARERVRLEQLVAQTGLADDPAGWIDRVAAAALDALSDRGEAFTSDLTRADPLLATRIRLGAGTRWEAEVSAASRVLPLLAAEGRIVRGRPRGRWTHGQYRWALAPGHGAELDTTTAQAELLRRWLGAFGPAFPLLSKSSPACGPRYQSRSFQPIVVGSSVGRSAADGSGAATGARSSARTSPDAPSRSTAAWGTAASAARASRAVQPVHQRISVSVAGPNLPSQRRSSSAWAVAVSSSAA